MCRDKAFRYFEILGFGQTWSPQDLRDFQNGRPAAKNLGTRCKTLHEMARDALKLRHGCRMDTTFDPGKTFQQRPKSRVSRDKILHHLWST